MQQEQKEHKGSKNRRHLGVEKQKTAESIDKDPSKGPGGTLRAVEEVIEKDKSINGGYTGWQKKHSTAKKKAAEWPLGWGGKGGQTGEGIFPLQSTEQPLSFTGFG